VTCAQCGEHEAIIFIRRNGGTEDGRDIVLCESCAAARGIIAGKGNLDINIDDLIGAALDESPANSAQASCPSCGMELGQLKLEGRLGCPACADRFPEEIAKAIGRGSKKRQEVDVLSFRAPLGAAGPWPFPESFPLPIDSSAPFSGPDDDVVLWSSAWVYRDIEGLSFPGSPRGSASPSRALSLPRFLESDGGGPAWRSTSMAALGSAGRRALAERGLLSRLYAADDEAPLLSDSGAGCYALLDEGDHIRIRALRAGLDPLSALGAALTHAEALGEKLPFAQRPGLGWICSRLSDCGLGASLSVLVHIPGLAATGMRDRLFRALMAEDLVLRGFYSNAEDSSASVYEICAEGASASSLDELCSKLGQAAAKLVGAERRARAEFRSRGLVELLDAEGRAYGILRHCRLIEAEEAASLLSTLRFAALRGSLVGVDPRALGARMLALGPGSVALASGGSAAPERELRAQLIKRELAAADYMGEEGGSCSKD
jgi:protein arginine kinase